MAQRVDTVCLKVGDWVSGQKHGGDVRTRGNVTMSKLVNYLRLFETKPCQSCHGKHRFFLKGKEEKNIHKELLSALVKKTKNKEKKGSFQITKSATDPDLVQGPDEHKTDIVNGFQSSGEPATSGPDPGNTPLVSRMVKFK